MPPAVSGKGLLGLLPEFGEEPEHQVLESPAHSVLPGQRKGQPGGEQGNENSGGHEGVRPRGE
jgi:hypothetical protein